MSYLTFIVISLLLFVSSPPIGSQTGSTPRPLRPSAEPPAPNPAFTATNSLHPSQASPAHHNISLEFQAFNPFPTRTRSLFPNLSPTSSSTLSDFPLSSSFDIHVTFDLDPSQWDNFNNTTFTDQLFFKFTPFINVPYHFSNFPDLICPDHVQLELFELIQSDFASTGAANWRGNSPHSSPQHLFLQTTGQDLTNCQLSISFPNILSSHLRSTKSIHSRTAEQGIDTNMSRRFKFSITVSFTHIDPIFATIATLPFTVQPLFRPGHVKPTVSLNAGQNTTDRSQFHPNQQNSDTNQSDATNSFPAHHRQPATLNLVAEYTFTHSASHHDHPHNNNTNTRDQLDSNFALSSNSSLILDATNTGDGMDTTITHNTSPSAHSVSTACQRLALTPSFFHYTPASTFFLTPPGLSKFLVNTTLTGPLQTPPFLLPITTPPNPDDLRDNIHQTITRQAKNAFKRDTQRRYGSNNSHFHIHQELPSQSIYYHLVTTQKVPLLSQSRLVQLREGTDSIPSSSSDSASTWSPSPSPSPSSQPTHNRPSLVNTHPQQRPLSKAIYPILETKFFDIPHDFNAIKLQFSGSVDFVDFFTNMSVLGETWNTIHRVVDPIDGAVSDSILSDDNSTTRNAPHNRNNQNNKHQCTESLQEFPFSINLNQFGFYCSTNGCQMQTQLVIPSTLRNDDDLEPQQNPYIIITFPVHMDESGMIHRYVIGSDVVLLCQLPVQLYFNNLANRSDMNDNKQSNIHNTTITTTTRNTTSAAPGSANDDKKNNYTKNATYAENLDSASQIVANLTKSHSLNPFTIHYTLFDAQFPQLFFPDEIGKSDQNSQHSVSNEPPASTPPRSSTDILSQNLLETEPIAIPEYQSTRFLPLQSSALSLPSILTVLHNHIPFTLSPHQIINTLPTFPQNAGLEAATDYFDVSTRLKSSDPTPTLLEVVEPSTQLSFIHLTTLQQSARPAVSSQTFKSPQSQSESQSRLQVGTEPTDEVGQAELDELASFSPPPPPTFPKVSSFDNIYTYVYNITGPTPFLNQTLVNVSVQQNIIKAKFQTASVSFVGYFDQLEGNNLSDNNPISPTQSDKNSTTHKRCTPSKNSCFRSNNPMNVDHTQNNDDKMICPPQGTSPADLSLFELVPNLSALLTVLPAPSPTPTVTSQDCGDGEEPMKNPTPTKQQPRHDLIPIPLARQELFPTWHRKDIHAIYTFKPVQVKIPSFRDLKIKYPLISSLPAFIVMYITVQTTHNYEDMVENAHNEVVFDHLVDFGELPPLPPFSNVNSTDTAIAHSNATTHVSPAPRRTRASTRPTHIIASVVSNDIIYPHSITINVQQPTFSHLQKMLRSGELYGLQAQNQLGHDPNGTAEKSIQKMIQITPRQRYGDKRTDHLVKRSHFDPTEQPINTSLIQPTHHLQNIVTKSSSAVSSLLSTHLKAGYTVMLGYGHDFKNRYAPFFDSDSKTSEKSDSHTPAPSRDSLPLPNTATKLDSQKILLNYITTSSPSLHSTYPSSTLSSGYFGRARQHSIEKRLNSTTIFEDVNLFLLSLAKTFNLLDFGPDSVISDDAGDSGFKDDPAQAELATNSPQATNSSFTSLHQPTSQPTSISLLHSAPLHQNPTIAQYQLEVMLDIIQNIPSGSFIHPSGVVSSSSPTTLQVFERYWKPNDEAKMQAERLNKIFEYQFTNTFIPNVDFQNQFDDHFTTTLMNFQHSQQMGRFEPVLNKTKKMSEPALNETTNHELGQLDRPLRAQTDGQDGSGDHDNKTPSPPLSLSRPVITQLIQHPFISATNQFKITPTFLDQPKITQAHRYMVAMENFYQMLYPFPTFLDPNARDIQTETNLLVVSNTTDLTRNNQEESFNNTLQQHPNETPQPTRHSTSQTPPTISLTAPLSLDDITDSIDKKSGTGDQGGTKSRIDQFARDYSFTITLTNLPQYVDFLGFFLPTLQYSFVGDPNQCEVTAIHQGSLGTIPVASHLLKTTGNLGGYFGSPILYDEWFSGLSLNDKVKHLIDSLLQSYYYQQDIDQEQSKQQLRQATSVQRTTDVSNKAQPKPRDNSARKSNTTTDIDKSTVKHLTPDRTPTDPTEQHDFPTKMQSILIPLPHTLQRGSTYVVNCTIPQPTKSDPTATFSALNLTATFPIDKNNLLYNNQIPMLVYSYSIRTQAAQTHSPSSQPSQTSNNHITNHTDSSLAPLSLPILTSTAATPLVIDLYISSSFIEFTDFVNDSSSMIYLILLCVVPLILCIAFVIYMCYYPNKRALQILNQLSLDPPDMRNRDHTNSQPPHPQLTSTAAEGPTISKIGDIGNTTTIQKIPPQPIQRKINPMKALPPSNEIELANFATPTADSASTAVTAPTPSLVPITFVPPPPPPPPLSTSYNDASLHSNASANHNINGSMTRSEDHQPQHLSHNRADNTLFMRKLPQPRPTLTTPGVGNQDTRQISPHLTTSALFSSPRVHVYESDSSQGIGLLEAHSRIKADGDGVQERSSDQKSLDRGESDLKSTDLTSNTAFNNPNHNVDRKQPTLPQSHTQHLTTIPPVLPLSASHPLASRAYGVSNDSQPSFQTQSRPTPHSQQPMKLQSALPTEFTHHAQSIESSPSLYHSFSVNPSPSNPLLNSHFNNTPCSDTLVNQDTPNKTDQRNQSQRNPTHHRHNNVPSTSPHPQSHQINSSSSPSFKTPIHSTLPDDQP